MVANDIFKLGVIHSDTDYTVYSGEATGSRPGLDFAFFSERQRYHTDHDTFVYNGSLQFMGDNTFALASYIVGTPMSAETVDDRTAHAYFTVYNTVFIAYSKLFSFVAHLIFTVLIIVAVVGSLLLRYKYQRDLNMEINIPFRQAFINFGVVMLSLIGGVLFALAFGGIAMALHSDFYYSNAGYLVFAFIFPTLTGIFVVSHYVVAHVFIIAPIGVQQIAQR